MNDVKYCPHDGYPFVLDESRCALCNLERSHVRVNHVGDIGHRQQWQKILYKSQPFEDNYTDSNSFLKDLQKNVNVEAYDYAQVAFDSLAVTQQLSLVILLLITFYHMLNNQIDPYQMIKINTMTSIFGFLIWTYTSYHNEVSFYHLNIWTTKLFYLLNYIIGLYFLSPLLGTLTDHISDDTIIVLILFLMIIHVVLQDYGFINALSVRSSSQQQRNFNAPVSLNAATFASVMLASRLQSYAHSFGIISFSIIIFALYPFIANGLKKKHPNGSYVLNLFILCAVLKLLMDMSRILSFVYIIVLLFITFVSPFCLKWIQRYKNEIHGPWDEAIPLVNHKN